MIRILLVDDQNLIQEGIKALLDQHTELKVIGTVKDGRNAVKLVSLLHPDIVLLDIEMPGMDGITVTKHISRIAPETKVIILTSYEDKKYITQSLLAGAKGYILKSSLMKDLKQAILAVDNGYCQLESRLLAKVFNSNNIKSKKTQSSTTSYSEEKQQDKEHIAEHSLTQNEAKPLEKPDNFTNKDSEQLLSDRKDVPTGTKDNNNNKSIPEQEVKPLKKTDNFTNKDSEQLLSDRKDVPTGTKNNNNEFIVSLNSSAISSPKHSVLVKSEIQPAEIDTLLTLPQIQFTQIISPEITNTLFSPPQIQTAEIYTLAQNQPTQIISVETANTEATLSQTEATQTPFQETSDTPSQNQPIEIISVETANTEATLSQTETIQTPSQETSDTPSQNQPIEIISVETANTEATLSQTEAIQTLSQTEATQTPSQNQPIEIISVETANTEATQTLSQTEATQTPSQNQPIEIISVETANTEAIPSQETFDISPQDRQENIQNSKAPLLPVVNRMALLMSSEDDSSLEDNTEKRRKNKLAAKSYALKKYFIQLVSKKNISRYKTNASIIIFQYRHKFHQYRVKATQYTKRKISQYNPKDNKYQIKLERSKSKLLSLIRFWQEKGLFSNIGLMILGAVIFFLIHSIFN